MALNYNGRQILHDHFEVTRCTEALTELGTRPLLFQRAFGFLGSTVKYILKLVFLQSTSYYYSSHTLFMVFSSPPTSRSNISLSHCDACAPAYTISLIPPTCFPNVSFHFKQVHLPPTCMDT